jgi:hypothetical protein
VPSPRISVEIMYEVPAAHNQYAFVTQWRELSANLEMEGCRLGLVNTQLRHGNIGVGIRVTQTLSRDRVPMSCQE